MEEVGKKMQAEEGQKRKALEEIKRVNEKRNIDTHPSIGKNTRNHLIIKPSIRKAENIFLENARKEKKNISLFKML